MPQTPHEAMVLRNRIGSAGLDFRNVYQTVGLERETDATPSQILRIEEMISRAHLDGTARDPVRDGTARDPVRAEAISAAGVGSEVEVLVLSRADDGTVVRALYTVGPVAARSLIWLLRDAVDEIDGTHTL